MPDDSNGVIPLLYDRYIPHSETVTVLVVCGDVKMWSVVQNKVIDWLISLTNQSTLHGQKYVDTHLSHISIQNHGH
jgi:hypothetical protein